MNQQPFLSAHTLLQHEPFVRAVVRGLLSDEERVRDVVQETWLTALRRPPRVRASLRSWLGRVAGNLARDSHRSTGRRRRREEAVARPEAMESVDVTHERLAAQREVVDVVLALQEPYRSVVLLHYYQDVGPTEIAERLERSPATVRSQLSRAREILRGALDAKFDGGRSVWSALLLPLLPEASPEAAIGKLQPAAVIKIAAATAGIATVAIIVGPKLFGGSEPSTAMPSALGGSAPAVLSSEPGGGALSPVAATGASTREPVEVDVTAIDGARREQLASEQTRRPLERDLSYAYGDGDLRFGSHRLQVTALPDGNYRYQLSARALFDLLATHQEIWVDGDYVVTPELRPVSMRVETGKLLGNSVVTGRRSEDTFTLSFDPSDASRDVVVAIDPEETVLFLACLDDWLARQGPATERATARFFDDQTWKLEQVVATRLRYDETGSEWRLDYGGGEEHTLTIDAQGVLVKGLLGAPNKIVVRCTADEARDLAPLNIDGPEVLVFPVDREIEMPHRVERLVVELTWKDIPFDEFELEDARQRLLERTETIDGHSAVVEIGAPPAVRDTTAIPVDDASLAPYLAETDFIKPTDPKILDAAKEVIAGTTNARDAVVLLSKWVYGYIESALILETLTGPEVLAGGRGKCTEYSTLFASMARAVGIPTRVVLGERMVAGNWMGHMWNEAWVGRWITVDTTTNEVDRAFLLLKFIHSDTVEGTQSLRWALTESLSISIEDVQIREPELAGLFETGIDGVTYTNVDFVARLTAPFDDWTLVDKSEQGTVVVSFDSPYPDNVVIHFVAFSVVEDTAPKAFIDRRIDEARGRFDTFDVLSNAPREVRGANGHTSHFRCRNGDKDAMLATELCWVRGPVGYLLTMSAREAAFESRHADFETLIASFRFLDE